MDGNGQVKGLKKGTADITASKGSLTATRTVRVIHEHSWDAGKVTKSATCTKDGEKTYTCSGCGETKTEVIKATGHKMGAWRTVASATTQKAGRQNAVVQSAITKKPGVFQNLKVIISK